MATIKRRATGTPKAHPASHRETDIQRKGETERERERALNLSIYPVCAHRARTCLRAYRLVVVRGKERAYALAKTLYCQRAVTEFVQQQMATIAGTFRSACMSVCVCAYTCLYAGICMYVCRSACLYMYVCISACLYMYVCAYVCWNECVCADRRAHTAGVAAIVLLAAGFIHRAGMHTHTQSFCLSSRWRPCTDADYLCVYVSMYLCVCLSGYLGARQRVRGPPSAWLPCLSSCGAKCARRYALSRCLLADTDTN
jgi:hypothetical protein